MWIYGGLWKYMKVYASIWKYVQVYGGVLGSCGLGIVTGVTAAAAGDELMPSELYDQGGMRTENIRSCRLPSDSPQS